MVSWAAENWGNIIKGVDGGRAFEKKGCLIMLGASKAVQWDKD